jgi:hypothetical protein
MIDYSTKYTLSSVHNDAGNDEVITHSFDATDATLGEVLEKIEIFLIAAGFDWIKKGEIQHVDSVTDEDYDSTAGAELFDEYSVSAEEMYNRLNGLDDTAKIVEFPKKEKPEETITLTTGSNDYIFSGEYDIGSITFDGMDITDGMNVTLDTSDISFTQDYNVSLTPDDVTLTFTNFENEKEKD